MYTRNLIVNYTSDHTGNQLKWVVNRTQTKKKIGAFGANPVPGRSIEFQVYRLWEISKIGGGGNAERHYNLEHPNPNISFAFCIAARDPEYSGVWNTPFPPLKTVSFPSVVWLDSADSVVGAT